MILRHILRLLETATLSFHIEHIGAHHGQHDFCLTARRDGQPVGHIDYTVYQRQPSIQLIKVTQGHREGIATAMLRHLQSQFPASEIDWGSLTDDGAALYHSLTFRVIPTPHYTELQARLRRVQATLADYQRQSEAFDADPSEGARQAQLAATADWNELHDREQRIKRVLDNLQPATRVIV